MRVVASEVLVIATFIPAAVQSTASCMGIVSGKTKQSKRPKADPEHIRGKMYPVDKTTKRERRTTILNTVLRRHDSPPRNPPDTVKEIATNLLAPTMNAFKGLFISKPSRPVVGQMLGRSLAGPMFATTCISSSPQKAKKEHKDKMIEVSFIAITIVVAFRDTLLTGMRDKDGH